MTYIWSHMIGLTVVEGMTIPMAHKSLTIGVYHGNE